MREEPVYQLNVSASTDTVSHDYERAVDVINPQHRYLLEGVPDHKCQPQPTPNKGPHTSERVLPPRAVRGPVKG